jgi:DNA-cytosine methyltransferase
MSSAKKLVVASRDTLAGELNRNNMKILSLFDGVSCARLALERAGIPVEAYYASEIDKYAIKVTQANRPDTVQLGDVSKLGKENPYPPELLNGVDLIIFGSPCQDLSIAGKNRKGLDGQRSGLFFEAVRIMKDIPHKYFIMENVASMSKEAKQVITEALGVEPIIINAALVSAQNRKRLFWTNIPGVTQPEDKGILLRHILELQVDENYIVKAKSNTVRSSGRGSGINDRHNWDTIRLGQIGKGGQGDRIYSQEGKSVALSALGGGRGAKTGLYAVALTETRTEEAKKIRKEHMKNGRDYSPRRAKELQPRLDNKSNTITTGSTKESLLLQPDMTIRKLTPT